MVVVIIFFIKTASEQQKGLSLGGRMDTQTRRLHSKMGFPPPAVIPNPGVGA